MRDLCGLLELLVKFVDGTGCSRRPRAVHIGRVVVVVVATEA